MIICGTVNIDNNRDGNGLKFVAQPSRLRSLIGHTLQLSSPPIVLLLHRRSLQLAR